MKNFSDQWKEELAPIQMSRQEQQQVLERVRRSGRRRRVAALVVVCCLLFTAVVGAANPALLKKAVTLAGGGLADLVVPINKSDEDNGIRVEVLGALNDDHQAVVYLAVQDLTGDRLDDTLDLNDPTIRGGGFAQTAQRIDYAPETKTALYCLQGDGENHLEGKKVKISIRDMYSHQEEQQLAIPMDLAALRQDPKTFVCQETGSGQEETTLLQPEQCHIPIPGLSWTYISAIGYVDGKLHVQMDNSTSEMGLNHGYFDLAKEDGTLLSEEQDILSNGIYFWAEGQSGKQYIEFILDVTPEQAQGLTLQGNFWTYHTKIEGSWNISFRLASGLTQKSTQVEEQFGDATLEKVTVSPMGLTLEGTGGEAKEEHPLRQEMEVVLDDGSVISCRPTIEVGEQEGDYHWTLRATFPEIQQVERMVGVRIGEKSISLS